MTGRFYTSYILIVSIVLDSFGEEPNCSCRGSNLRQASGKGKAKSLKEEAGIFEDKEEMFSM